MGGRRGGRDEWEKRGGWEKRGYGWMGEEGEGVDRRRGGRGGWEKRG